VITGASREERGSEVRVPDSLRNRMNGKGGEGRRQNVFGRRKRTLSYNTLLHGEQSERNAQKALERALPKSEA